MKSYPFGSVTERRDVSFNQKSERSKMHDSYTLSTRVDGFLRDAFPGDPSVVPKTRALRFLEEAMELAQSMGITKEKALEQLEYTFSREIGDPKQEFGGTVFTLTAVGNALCLDLIEEGYASVDEAYGRIEQIREKSKKKPHVV